MTGPELERLIQLLARLPGLGPRSARRAALALMKKRDQLLLPLAEAMREAAEKVVACSLCGNLICAECHVALAQHHLCKKCLAEAERVPAPFAPVAAPTPEAGEFSRKPSRFGHLAVPLIIGAVIGIAGANTTRREGIGMGMFLGAFAGLSVLMVGWIIASVIIPKDIQAERGGVLGALSISDYSEGLRYTTIVTVIFWVAIAG